jgi:hypothetical protein
MDLAIKLFAFVVTIVNVGNISPVTGFFQSFHNPANRKVYLPYA